MPIIHVRDGVDSAVENVFDLLFRPGTYPLCCKQQIKADDLVRTPYLLSCKLPVNQYPEMSNFSPLFSAANRPLSAHFPGPSPLKNSGSLSDDSASVSDSGELGKRRVIVACIHCQRTHKAVSNMHCISFVIICLGHLVRGYHTLFPLLYEETAMCA